MDLSMLREKLEKLFFINNLLYSYGVESKEACYVLEDEIKHLEEVYQEVKEQLENCI